MERPWDFSTDAQSDDFCRKIAADMVRLFGITEEEAIGRINRGFSHLKEFVPAIYHDPIEHWANTMYFGHDSAWWVRDDNVRARLRLPPVTPLPYP